MTDYPHLFVDSQEGLERAASALASCPRLYLDTEFESQRGSTRLCLLQISSGPEIFLVDTLKLGRLDALAAAFARPGVEWVFHAGLQDVALIEQRLHVPAPARLFDTQVAYALVSAESNVSLGYLRYQLLGARADKAHQADDWVGRPLSESQLQYAASDVHDLPALTELLIQRAEAKDRRELVFEASREALVPSREPPPPLTLEHFRNAWQLGPKSQAGLRFLIAWHNALSADDKSTAPDTKTLLALAARLPETATALGRIKGVSSGVLQRHGAHLASGMTNAARLAKSADFVPIEPPPYATFADIRRDAWLGLLRAEVCATLEVSPEQALPQRVVHELKAKMQAGKPGPLSDALRGFRKRLLGDAIDAFFAAHPPPCTPAGIGTRCPRRNLAEIAGGLINPTRRSPRTEMSSTSFIPTACHRCSRTWLALPTFELAAVCPSCHGQAEVVPGECYRADDVPLFQRIERAVFAAKLSEQASYRLWAVLSNVSERWRRPDYLLVPVVETLPALKFLIDDFSADRTQLARAVGMSLAAVTTQLRAAEAHRQSSGSAARALPEPQHAADATPLACEESVQAPCPAS